MIGGGEIKNEVGPEMSKQLYREKVWNNLEKNDLALFPRPVHGRIPNFKGSSTASHALADLEPFRKAVTVKICPDKPQEHVRICALQAHKTILMPIPRLREGLFQRLHLTGSVPREQIKYAASARGAKELGEPLGLDAKVKVDFVVLGSVAVSKEGYRIGKGEGFADLEYAILKEMGAIDDEVLVATSVHDCQVFEEIPRTLFKEHDAPIDIIVTPTKVIHVANKLPKPKGIVWNLLTPKQLKDMPILQHLRKKQIALGKDCSLKGVACSVATEKKLPPGPANRQTENYPVNRNKFGRVQSGYATSVVCEKNLLPKQASGANESSSLNRSKFGRVQSDLAPSQNITIRVSNISPNVRVRDLKTALISCGVKPTYITWRGSSGYALLNFISVASAPSSITTLIRNMKLGDSEISVEETDECR